MKLVQDVAKVEKEAREFISMVGRYSGFDENITWHMTVLGTAKAPFNVLKFRRAALNTLAWNPFNVMTATQMQTAGAIFDRLVEVYKAAGIDFASDRDKAAAKEQIFEAFEEFKDK